MRELDALVAVRGCASSIRVDNGPEFTAQPFVDWCADHRVTILYVQPGTPDQNACIERFNRTDRTEVLNAHLVESVAELRALTDAWFRIYNRVRPPRQPRPADAADASPGAFISGPQSAAFPSEQSDTLTPFWPTLVFFARMSDVQQAVYTAIRDAVEAGEVVRYGPDGKPVASQARAGADELATQMRQLLAATLLRMPSGGYENRDATKAAVAQAAKDTFGTPDGILEYDFNLANGEPHRVGGQAGDGARLLATSV